MDSFGQQRGIVAHNSSQVRTVLDPVSERAVVQQLISGLNAFDELLNALRPCP
jgi:hypothetical protein